MGSKISGVFMFTNEPLFDVQKFGHLRLLSSFAAAAAHIMWRIVGEAEPLLRGRAHHLTETDPRPSHHDRSLPSLGTAEMLASGLLIGVKRMNPRLVSIFRV